MNFKGLLEPLLKSLSPLDAGMGTLTGKYIPVRNKSCRVFFAKDRSGNVHFLVGAGNTSEKIEFQNVLSALTISYQSWAIEREGPQAFIDVQFQLSSESQLVRPYIGLCEDILLEIDSGENVPEAAVIKTLKRWKRFWSHVEPAAPSEQWIKGLLGELNLLRQIVTMASAHAITAWKGPDGFEQDFSGNGIGVEVKSSARIPPSIEVSGLNQLDGSGFESLLLCLFKIDPIKKGKSIPEIVREIEDLLKKDDESLELFWGKLAAVGYSRTREGDYAAFPFHLSRPDFFKITLGFPSLTKSSLSSPLDQRVSKVKYTLELSGISEFKVDPKEACALLQFMVTG